MMMEDQRTQMKHRHETAMVIIIAVTVIRLQNYSVFVTTWLAAWRSG